MQKSITKLYLRFSDEIKVATIAVNIIRSLGNDDGDGNKNGKKAISLDWQNNNFASASLFFKHFFAVAVRLQRESV